MPYALCSAAPGLLDERARSRCRDSELYYLLVPLTQVRAVSHCELGILTASRDKVREGASQASRGVNFVALETNRFPCRADGQNLARGPQLAGMRELRRLQDLGGTHQLRHRPGLPLAGPVAVPTTRRRRDGRAGPGRRRVGHGCVAAIPSCAIPRVSCGVLSAINRLAFAPLADKCEPVYMMSGHEYQVTCVGVLEGGVVVSGALDKTLRVWRGGECVRTLEGHEGPVLCLCVLPSGEVLSGSGDTTARLWDASTGECMGVFRGHSDSVRALCVLPGVGVVSGSHDTTCMVWSNQGDVLATLVGHTALVYGVAATADASRIASASEDKTVRVWRPDGACLQTVVHPACVWGVCFLPDGDMATACADSNAYVWTADPDR